MKPVSLKAPAKINLILKVLGKRPDGYHDIETVFVMVGLWDTLEVIPAPGGIRIECSDPAVPTGEENLAHRAAKLMEEETGKGSDVLIRLRKGIPVAAGLGGGSSDAAAVLKGLNSLFSLGLSAERLAGMGARIGADVPFFLNGPSAVGRGKGEELEPIRLRFSLPLVVVNPGVAVSTAWAYRNADLKLTKGGPDIRMIQSSLEKGDIERVAANLYNDLEEVVAKEYPQVASIKEELMELGASGSLMSGSGPTVFGLFKDSGSAERCFSRILSKYPHAYKTFSLAASRMS